MAGGTLWVRNDGEASVCRIDARTGHDLATIPVDPFVGSDGVDDLAVTPAGIWAGGLRRQRIDPASNRGRSAPTTARSGRLGWLPRPTGSIPGDGKLLDPWRVSGLVATTLKVGSAQPRITLEAQDGSERSLPDGSGPNLLVFYRGDW